MEILSNPAQRLADSAALRALLECQTNIDLPKEALAFVQQQAQGHSYIALEWVHWLARFGHLWSDGTAWHWREPERLVLPSRLEALIEKHLGAEITAPLLLAAALLPNISPDWTRVLPDTTFRLEQLGLWANNQLVHRAYAHVILKNRSLSEQKHMARRLFTAFAETDPVATTGLLELADVPSAKGMVHLQEAVKHCAGSLERGRMQLHLLRFAIQHRQQDLLKTPSHLLLLKAARNLLADAPHQAQDTVRQARAVFDSPEAQHLEAQITKRLEVDKAPATQQTKAPELEVLGEMRLFGQVLRERGRKNQELLAYLLEARIQHTPTVATQDLCIALYGAYDASSGAALKQLVYRLRGQFDPQLIVQSGTGYRLGEIDSDLERYLEHSDPELWRGAYLEDLGSQYSSVLRDGLCQRLEQQIGTLRQAKNKAASHLAQVLFTMHNEDPEALHFWLTVALEFGETDQLEQRYAQIRATFQELGQPMPSHWQDFLKHP